MKTAIDPNKNDSKTKGAGVTHRNQPHPVWQLQTLHHSFCLINPLIPVSKKKTQVRCDRLPPLLSLGRCLKISHISHVPRGCIRRCLFQTPLSGRIVTLLSISLSSTLRSLFGHRNLQRACILHKDYVSKKNFLIELYQDCLDTVSLQIEVFLLTVSVVSPKPGRFLSIDIQINTVFTYSESPEVSSPQEQGLILSFQTLTHFQTQRQE